VVNGIPSTESGLLAFAIDNTSPLISTVGVDRLRRYNITLMLIACSTVGVICVGVAAVMPSAKPRSVISESLSDCLPFPLIVNFMEFVF